MKRRRSDASTPPAGSPSIMYAFVERYSPKGERILPPSPSPSTPITPSRSRSTPSSRSGRRDSPSLPPPSTPSRSPAFNDALGRLFSAFNSHLLEFSPLASDTFAKLQLLDSTQRQILRLLYEESSPWVTIFRMERRMPRITRETIVEALNGLVSAEIILPASPSPPLSFILSTLTVELLLELVGSTGAVVLDARATKPALIESLLQHQLLQPNASVDTQLEALVGGCYVLPKAVSQTISVIMNAVFLDDADTDAASAADSMLLRDERFILREEFARQRFVQRGGDDAMSRLTRPFAHNVLYRDAPIDEEDRTVFRSPAALRDYSLALSMQRHFDILSAYLSSIRRWESSSGGAVDGSMTDECWARAIDLLCAAATRLDELKRLPSSNAPDPSRIPPVLASPYSSGAPVWLPTAAIKDESGDGLVVNGALDWKGVPLLSADSPSIFSSSPSLEPSTSASASSTARPDDLSSSFLDDVSEGGVLTRLLWHGVSLIDRMRVPAALEDKVAPAQIRDWLQLLLYLPFHKGRRGKWWTELAKVLKKLSPKYSLECCIQALNDPLLCAGPRITIETRMRQLLKIKPPLTTKTFNFPTLLGVSETDTVIGVRGALFAPIKGPRPMWLLPSDASPSSPSSLSAAVHVEPFAIAHYTDSGRNGLCAEHCEGSLWRAIFHLVLAEEIYGTPSCGANGIFRHRYQYGPLDLFAMNDFYMNRFMQIEEKLERIATGGAAALISSSLSLLSPLDMSRAPWLHSYSIDTLLSITRATPPLTLAAIIRTLSRNLGGMAAGLPDLVVWDPAAAEPSLRLVEVKGPSDRLSDEQRHWIHVLVESGARVVLCLVREGGAGRGEEEENEE